MYVNVVSFKVKKGDDITFLEMQKFEENVEAKPAGLDHFHILKDKNADNTYYLLEYWEDKAAKDKLEATESYQAFCDLRRPIVDKKMEVFECDLVV
jgi:quinol monooxygenase YgiN